MPTRAFGPLRRAFFLEIVMAFKRRKMSRKGSGKYFSATASKTHFMNVKPRPQRGGIRL